MEAWLIYSIMLVAGVQQGGSAIYIVFTVHVCTWKTPLRYTAVHVCVIRVHGAFFFPVRWPRALPWRPELRTSQDLPLRIRGPPGEGPAPRGGWLQPPTAAAPREAGPPPGRVVESSVFSARGPWEERPGEEHQAGAFPKRKAKSHGPASPSPGTLHRASSALLTETRRPTRPALPP